MKSRWSTPVIASACALASGCQPGSPAQAPEPVATAASQPEAMGSGVHVWEQLEVEPTGKGERRAVLDGRTTTLDRLHSHITTLRAGEVSGEPRLHLQEEVIIVKEGTVEAYFDGETQVATAGSTIFFASGATTALRNIGEGPATYHVVYYYTPLTPAASP